MVFTCCKIMDGGQCSSQHVILHVLRGRLIAYLTMVREGWQVPSRTVMRHLSALYLWRPVLASQLPSPLPATPRVFFQRSSND